MFPFRIKVIPTPIPTYLFLREIVVSKIGYNILIDRKIYSDCFSGLLNIVEYVRHEKDNRAKFHLLYIAIINKLCNFAIFYISLKKRA